MLLILTSAAVLAPTVALYRRLIVRDVERAEQALALPKLTRFG